MLNMEQLCQFPSFKYFDVSQDVGYLSADICCFIHFKESMYRALVAALPLVIREVWGGEWF